MGMITAPKREEIRVVATLIGTATIDGVSPKKMRGWLLEDKKLILATATPDFQIERAILDVASAKLGKSKASITLSNGQTVDMKLKSCNCGMGIIAAAKPVEGRFSIVRVPNPAWVEVI